jgi:hypothetical protein
LFASTVMHRASTAALLKGLGFDADAARKRPVAEGILLLLLLLGTSPSCPAAPAAAADPTREGAWREVLLLPPLPPGADVYWELLPSLVCAAATPAAAAAAAAVGPVEEGPPVPPPLLPDPRLSCEVVEKCERSVSV